MIRGFKIMVMIYLLAGLVYFNTHLLSQDKPATPDTSSEYLVKKKSFQPELSLHGVIIPNGAEQIKIDLKEFKNSLKVKSIVPSYTFVKEGDVLFTVDMEMIDQAIGDAVYKFEGMKLDIEQAKSKITADEKNQQQELEKTQIHLADKQKELKNYKDIEWPLQKDKDDLTVKRNEAWVSDQITELQQLDEMYKGSEIAGKTKEIVLERAKRDTEIAKVGLDIARRDADYNRQISNPKRFKELTNEEKWAKENLELLESRSAINLAEAKQSLSDQEFEFKKHTGYLARLKADREFLTIRAKKSGVVVHANLIQRLLSGKAPGLQTYEEIKEGDIVPMNEPILSLYSTESYDIATSIPERFRYFVKENNTTQVYINSLPDKVFTGIVSRISNLGDNTGDSGITFSSKLNLQNNDTRLRPGLTCTVKFELDKLNDVIVIPANLLMKRDNKSFVNLREGERVIEKEVIIGVANDTEVWVASGLKEGDVIVSKK